ncbi:MAG: hypothetical protein HW387_372 [Parachlamydiales bacterium]|nr:hypothetical protein [Parachlamydiales bacterium]
MSVVHITSHITNWDGYKNSITKADCSVKSLAAKVSVVLFPIFIFLAAIFLAIDFFASQQKPPTTDRRLSLVQQKEFHDVLTHIMSFLNGPQAPVKTSLFTKSRAPLVIYNDKGEWLSLPPSSISRVCKQWNRAFNHVVENAADHLFEGSVFSDNKYTPPFWTHRYIRSSNIKSGIDDTAVIVHPELRAAYLRCIFETAHEVFSGKDGRGSEHLESWKKLSTECCESKRPIPAVNIANMLCFISKNEWAAAATMNLPPYPQALIDFLKETCPFSPGNINSDMVIVVPLFPQVDIDGTIVPLTLKSLDQLDKSSGGTGCRLNSFGTANYIPAEEEFRYAVMTRDVIPGSRNMSYKQQLGLLPPGYEAPRVFDAVRAILWENRRSGNRCFNDNPWTYTRCKEIICGYNLVVGGFAPSGLYVDDSRYYDDECFGVAGWRKF